MEIPRQFYFVAVRGSARSEFRIQDEPKPIYFVVDSIAPEGNPDLHTDRDLPIIGGIWGTDAFLQSGFDVDKDGNTFPIDWKNLGQYYRFKPSFQRSIAGRYHYYVGEPWLPKPKQKTNAPYENLGLGGFMDYVNGLDF